MSGMATDSRVRAELRAIAQVIPHPRALARMKNGRRLTVPPGSMGIPAAARPHHTGPRPVGGSAPAATRSQLTGPRPVGGSVPAAIRSRVTASRPVPGSRPVAPAAARRPVRQPGAAARRQAAPGTPAAGPRVPQPAAHGVRLTRRGRMVVTGLLLVGMLMVVVLAWLALAGPAQAAGPGAAGPGAVYRNLTTVVVRPGQTLWSIALRAEPGADPRVVIREIVDLNALSSTVVEPGQQLLVPRSR